MMAALNLWPTVEVVFSVNIMMMYMGPIVMFEVATTSRLDVRVHVKTIRSYGISILFAMVVKHCLVSIAFSGAPKLKTSLGFLSTTNGHNLMTNNQLLSNVGLHIFCQPGYTVWRQSVHHVGW
jgi:hypothetical protein